MSKTHVLLSFGAINGGFEFAMALRWDIMKKLGKKWEDEPHFVYLDAESLRDDSETKYPWDGKLGIYKMSNANWKKHYIDAMIECSHMIFLISEPWLKSKWCWDEYNWYLKVVAEGKLITPIFVIFKDAEKILTSNNIIEDSEGTKHNLKDSIILTGINNSSCIVDIKSDSLGELKNVKACVKPPDGSESKVYEYVYKYVCSKSELNQILSKIKISP
jgi:hypothetical protein